MTTIELRGRTYAIQPKADLRGADLRGADLRGADLSEANLSWADLSWADLSGANLSGANLSEANLSEANLRWANLSWADLSWANLSWANLRWANLSGANLPSPTMVLLANWGELSDELTADLMIYDASCHPDPSKFSEWARTGSPCPYDGVRVQRAARFEGKSALWDPSRPPRRPYDLMLAVLREKTKDYEPK